VDFSKERDAKPLNDADDVFHPVDGKESFNVGQIQLFIFRIFCEKERFLIVV